MIHLLSVLVPVALAAGVSPMMFSEQLLLLGTSDGRRAGRRYLAGTATVLAVLIAAVVTLGGSLALPHAPTLSAGLDVVLGLTLLAVAVLVHLRRPRPRRRKNTRGSQAAFGFGVFSMATNFTTLPLVVAAAKNIASSGVSVFWQVIAVLILLVGACLPAWLPLVIDRLPEGRRILDSISQGLEKHDKTITVAALAIVGVLLTVKGVLGMV